MSIKKDFKIKTNRFFCISDYGNWNLESDHYDKLFSLCKDFVIYHKGVETEIDQQIVDSDKFIRIRNKGSNISDYLRFINDNYPYFPEEVGFIKGNTFPRHISLEEFSNRLNSSGFIPLYFESKTLKPQYNIFQQYIFQQIMPGICIEKSNNWYVKRHQKGKYFPLIENMFNRYISKSKIPKYVPFVPGACMIVESKNILRWDKSVYEELFESVSWQANPNPHPVEAWHFERLMLYFFYYEKYSF
jgi:hypothetical protein